MNQASMKGSCILRGLAAVLLFVAGSSPPAAALQLAGNVSVPAEELALGTIELPRPVLADGQALPAGAYDVHLTSRTASPETAGTLGELERWVEFRQGGAVMGRELASIVPATEIGDIAASAPPASGSSRVEVLRGNDYVRVWINRDGTHYLIHLAVG
ncbi:MAG: hypothetical protein J4G16_04290 [Acidobacteria bacterium]|nr:hypothetical protein [Acidobacteriota bacterium]